MIDLLLLLVMLPVTVGWVTGRLIPTTSAVWCSLVMAGGSAVSIAVLAVAMQSADSITNAAVYALMPIIFISICVPSGIGVALARSQRRRT